MKKRLNEEKAGTVTILGMSIIILSLLIGVFVADFIKALYIKNLYNSFAQKAAQTAIKQQDSIGGLKPESAQAFVVEYMTQRGGGGNTGDTQAHRTHCELTGNYPKIKLQYDTTRQIGANSPVFSSDNGNVPSMPSAFNFYQNQYRVIQAEITDVTDNYFFSIFGEPCAEIHITVSAIATTHYDSEDYGK